MFTKFSYIICVTFIIIRNDNRFIRVKKERTKYCKINFFPLTLAPMNGLLQNSSQDYLFS